MTLLAFFRSGGKDLIVGPAFFKQPTQRLVVNWLPSRIGLQQCQESVINLRSSILRDIVFLPSRYLMTVAVAAKVGKLFPHVEE